MKIDRLIGILALLLQRDQVTTLFLAERFEVSRRTINRDIEHLCKAGIPLVTIQGRYGGISIMEGYKIDKTILTTSEMQAIFTGLKSLESISSSNKHKLLMDKLSLKESCVLSSNEHILIDLTSWYKSSLTPKIETFQQAISNKEMISFRYYSPMGESNRTIEPYLLIFQWSSWYIWGYCRDRSDYRLFKLNRMLDLEGVGEVFIPRKLPSYQCRQKELFSVHFEIEARFENSMKWRLIEEYGINSFTENQDGSLLFCFDFTDKDRLIGWLLSFGDKVELLKPEVLREELKNYLIKIQSLY